jgi:hypothetical protein
MSKIPAIKVLVFTAFVACGLGFSGGCGGEAPSSGAVVTEDLKATQDREKMIAEQYKKTPQPVPSKK